MTSTSSSNSGTGTGGGSGSTDPDVDANNVDATSDDDSGDLDSPPTFEQLPPRHGTIVEIHSLKSRSDLNGTLGEFLNVVSTNGRYAVMTKKEEEGKERECSIAIKPENCHRPKLLPLKVRQQLVMEFNDRLLRRDSSSSSSSSSSDDDLERWVVDHALKKTDPCFVLGHLFLGDQQVFEKGSSSSVIFSILSRTPSRQQLKAAIPHYRRAVANMYAYEFDLSDQEEEKKKSNSTDGSIITDDTTVMMRLAAALGQLATFEERTLPVEARELFRSVHSKEPNHMHATFGVAEALWEDLHGGSLATLSQRGGQIPPHPSTIERMKEPVNLYLQVIAAPKVDPDVNSYLAPAHRDLMIRKSQEEVRHYLGEFSPTYMQGIGGTVGVRFGKTAKVNACHHIIDVADRLFDLSSKSSSPSETSTSSVQPSSMENIEMDPVIRSAVLAFKGTALGHLSLIVAEERRQEARRQTTATQVQQQAYDAAADQELWQQMEVCFRRARQVGSNVNVSDDGHTIQSRNSRQQQADVNLSLIIYHRACIVEKRGDVLMMMFDDFNPSSDTNNSTREELEQQAKVSFEQARDLFIESNGISHDPGTSESLTRVSAKLNPNFRCRVNRVTGGVEAMATTNNAFIRR